MQTNLHGLCTLWTLVVVLAAAGVSQASAARERSIGSVAGSEARMLAAEAYRPQPSPKPEVIRVAQQESDRQDIAKKIRVIEGRLDAILAAPEVPVKASPRAARSSAPPAALSAVPSIADDVQLQKSLALRRLEDLQKLNVERDLSEFLRQSR